MIRVIRFKLIRSSNPISSIKCHKNQPLLGYTSLRRLSKIFLGAIKNLSKIAWRNLYICNMNKFKHVKYPTCLALLSVPLGQVPFVHFTNPPYILRHALPDPNLNEAKLYKLGILGWIGKQSKGKQKIYGTGEGRKLYSHY